MAVIRAGTPTGWRRGLTNETVGLVKRDGMVHVVHPDPTAAGDDRTLCGRIYSRAGHAHQMLPGWRYARSASTFTICRVCGNRLARWIEKGVTPK